MNKLQIAGLFTMIKQVNHPREALADVLRKREPDRDEDDTIEAYPRAVMDMLNFFNTGIGAPMAVNKNIMLLDLVIINGLYLPAGSGRPRIDIYKVFFYRCHKIAKLCLTSFFMWVK